MYSKQVFRTIRFGFQQPGIALTDLSVAISFKSPAILLVQIFGWVDRFLYQPSEGAYDVGVRRVRCDENSSYPRVACHLCGV